MSNEHDTLRRNIERDEAWLAEQMAAHPTPECRHLGQIREQVRMAVHLEALEVAPPGPPAAEVLAGVKAAIRAELGEPRVAPRGRQPWIAMVAAAGLAAAACLVLSVASRSMMVAGGAQQFRISALDEFIDVINTNGASGVPAGDEITAALASSVDDQTDASLDELADELDELLAELDEPFDV